VPERVVENAATRVRARGHAKIVCAASNHIAISASGRYRHGRRIRGSRERKNGSPSVAAGRSLRDRGRKNGSPSVAGELRDLLRKHFVKVKFVKPGSSRADSSETFLVAQGFRK
jgi:hypothetical protein